MHLAQPAQDRLAVFVAVGLQVRPPRIEIADVLEQRGAHGAHSFYRLVAAIARAEDRAARLVVVGEYVARLHPVRYFDPRQPKGQRRHVNVLDGVPAHFAPGDSRSAHDERNAHPFVVQELLATRMADPVVGDEDEYRLLQVAGVGQSRDDPPHFPIGITHRVQIIGPVLEDDRIARVIGRQRDLLWGRVAAQGFLNTSRPLRVVAVAAVFASVELYLYEERLALLTFGPVHAVVDALVPLEVVVGLGNADTRIFLNLSVRTHEFFKPEVQRQVPGILEQLRHELYLFRQVNLQRAAPAAVLVGADGRLVHPGDHGRTGRRANRAGNHRVGESNALAREGIHTGRLDGRFAVTREVRRHVLNDDPQNVRARRVLDGRGGSGRGRYGSNGRHRPAGA